MTRIARGAGRGVVYVVAVVLVLIGLALAAIQTGWGKNQIRRLIVSQANRYLLATLDIQRVEGSILRSIELVGIRLSRDGRTLISIDRVSLRYSLRELFDRGTVIRDLRLERPHVAARRQPDGRWDLAALVKREARQQERTGPGRPIEIRHITVVDGDVEFRDPLSFGAAHLPTIFKALNTSVAFAYQPVRWRLDFDHLSFRGSDPDLTLSKVTGSVSNGNEGVGFDELLVETPQSAFVLGGRIVRGGQPTTLDLRVHSTRFVFQEWSGVLNGLKNIAVDAAFDAHLTGPLSALATDLTLKSNGGDVRGPFVLDTTVPGWHGRGSVSLDRFNLARWLNRPDRPSDISGTVAFNLALQLGHVPHGSYSFAGSHAAYLGYEGDNIRAQGIVKPDEVLINQASAAAYGATVRLSSGSITFTEPYLYHFVGSAAGVDLRRVPEAVPVPHVESTLAFNYDVTGQFTRPFIRGDARFDESEFLGAAIGAGTVGSIDTSATPIRYSGEGDVTHLDLHRFGAGLEVAWMQQPRYAGSLDGHFHVDGAGSDRATMTLTGGGQLTRADFFNGRLSNAAVSVEISGGSLRATYDGRLEHVNPAIAMEDPRYTATLTGTGRADFRVTDLLVRDVTIDDYLIDAELQVENSRAHGVPIGRGSVKATLSGGALDVAAIDIRGASIDAHGSGLLEFDGEKPSRFDYVIDRAVLADLSELLGTSLPGDIATTGRLTGPFDRLQLVGSGTANGVAVSGVSALTTTATYDVTIPSGDPLQTVGRLEGHASFVEAFDQEIQQVDGTVAYDNERIEVDLQLAPSEALKGHIKASLKLHSDRHAIDLSSTTVTIENSSWRLADSAAPSTISWDERGIAVTPMTFTATAGSNQRIDLAGTWRDDGSGTLRLNARRVFLDTFSSEIPARYGGLIDVDATLRGTRQRPLVAADLTISDGRVRQFSYQKLAGHIDYADEFATIDLRLDQSPGVWLTAAGTVPIAAFQRNRPEKPIDVAIASSPIGLGLIEGVTDVVRNVSGEVRMNLNVVGTSVDPHVSGTVDLTNAGFVVVSSGARYKNGRAVLRFATDSVAVETFHLEDNRGRPLEVRGSLATHELRVSALEVDISAKGFEVMRNEFGNIDVDAKLNVGGRFDSPRFEGTITIAGGELKVDEILAQSLFRPYSTQPSVPPPVDAVAALNPWERLGMNIQLHVPGTLRMTGREVQVNANSPIGLGSINLRAIGDLYLYKDPAQPLYVNGYFDSLTGTYAFQGRQFDLDPASSIAFRGDLNPELYVTVSRVISGVETRVAITGSLREPELRLTSNPPLDPSDILSLIVFNASANDLNTEQQRDLAIRAGALAAGFLATPLVNAVQRSLGLTILEIEAPQGSSTGPRVTVGQEFAPGLVARFSRQFGTEDYDEATVEYQLSRILRIRATFSDVDSSVARPLFRRAERAGIDLILFFSF